VPDFRDDEGKPCQCDNCVDAEERSLMGLSEPASFSTAINRLFREYDRSNLRHDVTYEALADALDEVRYQAWERAH
jgi:hypothetical protein